MDESYLCFEILRGTPQSVVLALTTLLRLTHKGLNNDWHHCRIVQAEMVHFLRQLQAFCQLEVIECSWQSLIDFTEKREGDLDALIQAHRTYLDRVVRKILLLGSKRDKEEIMLDLVRDALEFILQFRDATVSICREILDRVDGRRMTSTRGLWAKRLV